jgi:alkylhydroperoxidase family enzyme
VRRDLSAPSRLCELAICLVAVLNGAEYEFVDHAPAFLRAGGTQAELDALRDYGADVVTRAAGLFNTNACAVLQVAVAMIRKVRVPEAALRELRAALGSDCATVEIIGTIAAYNMVPRFLVATGVMPE